MRGVAPFERRSSHVGAAFRQCEPGVEHASKPGQARDRHKQRSGLRPPFRIAERDAGVAEPLRPHAVERDRRRVDGERGDGGYRAPARAA